MASFVGFVSTSCPTVTHSSFSCNDFDFLSLRLCDIGFNALDDMFRGFYNGKHIHATDFDQVILRASSLGVESMLCTAGNIIEAKDTIQLCRNHAQATQTRTVKLISTVGVHPTRCNIFSELGEENVLSELRNIIIDGIADGTVVAVGECGLDYDRLHFCEVEQQRTGFVAQLQLAFDFKLPVFFHDRNSNGDFHKIVTENSHLLPAGGVVHSFTGTMDEMQQYISIGLYIGINGCSLKTDANLEVVRAIPADRLLIETDAPWCGIKASHAGHKHISTKIPSVKKEKFSEGLLVKDRNEPCHLIQVLEVVAAVRGCDPLELACSIRDNTRKLFPTIYRDQE
jgi:TatD DNase family protein